MFDVIANRRANLTKVLAGFRSKSDLAKKLGRSPQQIGAMLSGKKGFGGAAARDFERILGLQKGDLDSDTFVYAAANPQLPAAIATDQSTDSLSFTTIDLQSLGLRAPLHADLVEMLKVKSAWLFANRVSAVRPENVRLMTVTSDAMSPAIKKGDTVLIDTSEKLVSTNGIYALRYSGTVILQRVQIMPNGKVKLIFDNAAYQSLEVSLSEEIAVLGRSIAILALSEL